MRYIKVGQSAKLARASEIEVWLQKSSAVAFYALAFLSR